MGAEEIHCLFVSLVACSQNDRVTQGPSPRRPQEAFKIVSKLSNGNFYRFSYKIRLSMIQIP